LIGDVPRVNGQLAVARAFGDQSLKAQLSSEPDVKHVQINSSVEFVILASDGLWKVCVFPANLTFIFSPSIVHNLDHTLTFSFRKSVHNFFLIVFLSTSLYLFIYLL
jgi:serine/threonine protein phosphatase PrpC